MTWTTRTLTPLYVPGVVVQPRKSKTHVRVNGRLMKINNAVIYMTGVVWATKHPLELQNPIKELEQQKELG